MQVASNFQILGLKNETKEHNLYAILCMLWLRFRRQRRPERKTSMEARVYGQRGAVSRARQHPGKS